MRKKTYRQLEEQYKKLLGQAFPLLRFKGITWNWDKVYGDNPFQTPKFLRIHRAFISAAKKRKHPFYC